MTLSAPEKIDFVEAFADAAERFAVSIASSDLTRPVPACPGWTAYDLAVHLGNTHGWAATIVETSKAAAEQDDAPESQRPADVSRWYAGKAEDLFEVLRSADPDAPCWNFSGLQLTNGFWRRRQLLEVAMHQVDLDQAGGLATGVSPAVGAAGVAEVFETTIPRMHQRGFAIDLRAPLTVHCTDTGHAWTLEPVPGHAPRVAVRTEPGADLVEGPAGAVWMLLWKRAPLDHPDVAYVGNRDRVAAFMNSPLTP